MSGITKLKGLLFSTDAQVVCVMNQVMDNFEIETEVCQAPGSALDRVSTMQLDTLIIDWTGSERAPEIIAAMRGSQQNAKSTVLAMVQGDEEMLAARRAGANFVMYKPISVDQATRFLRAAYGNMLLQRRWAARCQVDIPAVVHLFGSGSVPAKIVNLSARGLAFVCEYDIRVDQQLTLQFKLPGLSATTQVQGQVMNIVGRNNWTRCGVCFSPLPQGESDALEAWLSEHLPQQSDEVISAES